MLKLFRRRSFDLFSDEIRSWLQAHYLDAGEFEKNVLGSRVWEVPSAVGHSFRASILCRPQGGQFLRLRSSVGFCPVRDRARVLERIARWNTSSSSSFRLGISGDGLIELNGVIALSYITLGSISQLLNQFLLETQSMESTLDEGVTAVFQDEFSVIVRK